LKKRTRLPRCEHRAGKKPRILKPSYEVGRLGELRKEEGQVTRTVGRKKREGKTMWGEGGRLGLQRERKIS